MHRHEFLRHLHSRLTPDTYLEIGVAEGASLALSRATSVAIDPAFQITRELRCNVQLVRTTADDFFARPDPVAHFGLKPIDLAFIDGMHLFEYALRDFVNVERYTHPFSVIVLDDVLPRNASEAARERRTNLWAGDVYKVIAILHRYRPDLVALPLDTQPTGVAVVLGADACNTVLRENYDEICAAFAADDPQPVPEDILERRGALKPEQVLDASFWSWMENGRGHPTIGRDALRAQVDKTFGSRIGAST